jgi:hypothetical protein
LTRLAEYLIARLQSKAVRQLLGQSEALIGEAVIRRLDGVAAIVEP